MPNHMYIWFYMVVGKWFAPCGKCEENWGHWAWVIGQLSLRGMEVLPLSAGLRLLFTFQTEELRGTRRGEWWTETPFNTFQCCKQWLPNILTITVTIEMTLERLRFPFKMSLEFGQCMKRSQNTYALASRDHRPDCFASVQAILFLWRAGRQWTLYSNVALSRH